MKPNFLCWPFYAAFVLVITKWLLYLQTPCQYSLQETAKVKNESTACQLNVPFNQENNCISRPCSLQSSSHRVKQCHKSFVPQQEQAFVLAQHITSTQIHFCKEKGEQGKQLIPLPSNPDLLTLSPISSSPSLFQPSQQLFP